MKSKTKKIIASIVLILLSYGFIIFKILNFKELKEISFSSLHFSSFYLLIFSVVILLMFLNWSIETIKWKILIDKIQAFSFFNAFKAIFAGITIGIFTPNRVGEIGGRVLFLDKGKRTFGVLATGIGSFAQFITTISTGIFGFILFLLLFPDNNTINSIFNKIPAIGLLLMLLILIWIITGTFRFMLQMQKAKNNCLARANRSILIKNPTAQYFREFHQVINQIVNPKTNIL